VSNITTEVTGHYSWCKKFFTPAPAMQKLKVTVSAVEIDVWSQELIGWPTSTQDSNKIFCIMFLDS